MFKKVRNGLTILGLLLPVMVTHAQQLFTDEYTTDAAPGKCNPYTQIFGRDYEGSLELARPCDVTFTVTPIFFNFCNGIGQLPGVYTITNNTSVNMKINYIRIQTNDSFPPSATTFTTTCGTFLAPGASCDISVTLAPGAATGTYNRTLQIGINSRQLELDATPITSTVIASTDPICSTPPSPPPANFLGAACGYGVLAGTAVSSVPPSTINGSLGISPGSTLTGAPIVTGTTDLGNTAAANAQLALTAAYDSLKGRICQFPIVANLGGQTLTPGVYCNATSIGVTGTVILDGGGDANATFIFQAGSSLTTAGTVFLINGTQSQNVFWQVGSSATLGTGTVFVGTIAALTSITLDTGTTMDGRALARKGAVTLGSSTITVPVCPP